MVSIREGGKSECGYNMTSGKCAGDMGVDWLQGTH